jgi:hypothetical protein
MKNSLKLSFITLAIAASAAACTGNASKPAADSATIDSSALKADTAVGKNGSPLPIDSGIDHSGSGGTDTIQKSN